MSEVRDSSEWGWQVISRAEYEAKRWHDYAGSGTPLHPDRPGHWVMGNENGATVLYTGVEVVCESCGLSCCPIGECCYGEGCSA